jgi:hypothetical protein
MLTSVDVGVKSGWQGMRWIRVGGFLLVLRRDIREPPRNESTRGPIEGPVRPSSGLGWSQGHYIPRGRTPAGAEQKNKRNGLTG